MTALSHIHGINRTGLTVHAELDTGSDETGIRVSDQQMDALPLDRHDWHGECNYTLRPEPSPQTPHVAPNPPAPDPFDQPSPGLAWLVHPAVTALTQPDWDTLITRLTTLHNRQREAQLDTRRGHRPRPKAPGTGRRPALTLADRLLATIPHHRLGLPQIAIAALFTVTPHTINKPIRDIRQLLAAAGHIIHPADQRLATLQDIHSFASHAGIATPSKIKSAC